MVARGNISDNKTLTTAIKNRLISAGYIGGADGTQTHDLYDANVALYQLSYNPKTGADKKTRTSKALLPLVPETSASTNFAIRALRCKDTNKFHPAKFSEG